MTSVSLEDGYWSDQEGIVWLPQASCTRGQALHALATHNTDAFTAGRCLSVHGTVTTDQDGNPRFNECPRGTQGATRWWRLEART